jgi:hypothetical protein
MRVRFDLLPVVWAAAMGFAVVAWVGTPEPPRVSINPAVLALPGITRPYIDSLIAVAGRPGFIDTLPTTRQGYVRLYADSEGEHMYIEVTCGFFEARRQALYLNPHRSCYGPALGQSHPIQTTTPAGVLAHEFGHLLLFRLAKENPTLPEFVDGGGEWFADRVSLVILALFRGDAPRMSNDTLLIQYIVQRISS